MPQKTLLVLPAFRESKRLPPFLRSLCDEIALEPTVDCAVLTVDDGSGTAESEAMQKVYDNLHSRFPFLLPPLLLEKNRGKGGAIYAGWQTATPDIDWLAFVDSDGAVSARETVRFLKTVGATESSAGECLFAVRTEAEDTEVKRTLVRGLMGKVFRFLVKAIHQLPIPDTQCGLKAVTRADFEKVNPFLTEHRFCFDVDLSRNLKAIGTTFRIFPISWNESPGSTIRLSSTIRMFLTVFRLKFQALAKKP
jgi:dolichyl-phosphate beta-glucosyltransferase